MKAGMIISTTEVDGAAIAEDLAPWTGETKWTGWLRHERVELISYPFEWSFSMLRDAAILQLDVIEAAIEEDMILEDGSPYNVQFRGTTPVFIDIGSFQRLAAGEPWAGYRQFCQLCLFPLMLEAYKGVSFRPWLRGSLEGIEAETMRRLMSNRDLLRRGVFLHVLLQAKLQSRMAATDRSIKQDLRRAGFHKTLILANVRRLRRLIRRLSPPAEASAWSDYEQTHGYSREDRAIKEDFVRRASAVQTWNMVWDLGCNTGTFARIAAEHAHYTLATDADPVVIDLLYQRLRDQQDGSILPLVVNWADSTSGIGWRGKERQSLTDRGRPDLTLCLGFLHHLVIGAHVPLTDFLDWLAELDTDLVIEFIDKRDPAVARMLRDRPDIYDDYQPAVFETRLRAAFDIVDRKALPMGTRTLYFARRCKAAGIRACQ